LITSRCAKKRGGVVSTDVLAIDNAKDDGLLCVAFLLLATKQNIVHKIIAFRLLFGFEGFDNCGP
jgi:hypothetical protein